MQIEQIVKDARSRLAACRAPNRAQLVLPSLSAAEAARLIDHTLLKPEATAAQIRALCREAVASGFASVCVNPTWVSMCKQLLTADAASHRQVAICAVIGFPLGATLSAVKAFETTAVLEAGASEVDMVINIGALRDGDYETVLQDIRTVVDAAAPFGAVVKVILETCLLTDEEKAIAVALCVQAGADFVKTSTGFNAGGATLEDVALLRAVVGTAVGVKAAGGVHTSEDFLRMVAAGATRIGTSGGVAILAGLRARDDLPNQPQGIATNGGAAVAARGDDY